LSAQEIAKKGEPILFKDQLKSTDQKNQGKYFKFHKLELTGGRPYTIELASTEFDTFLVLLDDDAKKVLTHNDDIAPGNTQRSRIDFPPQRTATFTIAVTTFRPGETGAYTLTVQQYEAPSDKMKN